MKEKKAKAHESNFANILIREFGEDKVFANPIYFNEHGKGEFCDTCLKIDESNIIIFQLYETETNYLNKKDRWNKILNALDKKRSQIKTKNIEPLNSGRLFFPSYIENIEDKEFAINSTKNINYHYFIIIDGYTEYMSDIIKQRVGFGEEGGLSIQKLTKPMQKIKNDFNLLTKQDDEFIIKLERSYLKGQDVIIHIIDKETYEYDSLLPANESHKTNIFDYFFKKNSKTFLKYLKDKENWLKKILQNESISLFVEDERSLVSFYCLNNYKFPMSGEKVSFLFKKLDSSYNLNSPCIESMRFIIKTKEFYNNNFIQIHACFEDFFNQKCINEVKEGFELYKSMCEAYKSMCEVHKENEKI
jgi:hypothetical protein